MGKNKNGFSLLEAYLAAGMASSSNTPEHVPLPDSMRTSTLIEQIGKEHNWSDEQINEDIHILECNRLYYVRELRELSNSSWKAIQLLPLVKDLLRNALEPDRKMNGKEKKKKDKKQEKKKKSKKKLGSPVLSTASLVAEPTPFMLSGDPETIRNTIRNSSVDLTATGTGSLKKNNNIAKSVSFSEDDVKRTDDMASSSSNSSSSSSSSGSSSESECDEKRSTEPKKEIMFTGRPIKVVSSNRIRVRTSDNQVFECDRFCPHKKVDLATWGQVLGNSVICTKHNWNFSMQGVSTNGRTLNPCQVNDW